MRDPSPSAILGYLIAERPRRAVRTRHALWILKAMLGEFAGELTEQFADVVARASVTAAEAAATHA